MDENKGLYTIGTVADLIDEHPETLRVWERNHLVRPDRSKYQRRYSNNDIKRLKFIKYMLDTKGLNLAGVRQITSMYPCWYGENCRGGGKDDGDQDVNLHKPCWKMENTYCIRANDKSEMCSACKVMRKCATCDRTMGCMADQIIDDNERNTK